MPSSVPSSPTCTCCRGARATLVVAVVLGGLLSATTPIAARSAQPAVWQQWRYTRGVVDVVGPRGDGRLLVAARGRLFLLRVAGARLTAYPTTAYRASAKVEPYITVAAAGKRVPAASCSFARDTVYAIEPTGRRRILTVTPDGRVSALAAIPGVKTLNGIAFDTTGRFGGRLLVVGLTDRGRGVLASVDCRGRVHVHTRTAPHLEGGIVVAPAGFGAFGGDLLAPDEIDGRLLAIAPDGSIRAIVDPGQPAGGDIGVESLGIVPSGSASAYLADRSTPGNAHPGHDAILRLGAQELAAAGVTPGDLLASLEGGGATIAVHCSRVCNVREIATAPAGAHPEGSISFAH